MASFHVFLGKILHTDMLYTALESLKVIVYDLKSVGPLEFKLVAPMPDVTVTQG